MTLLQSWKNCLLYITPTNFKLYLVDSLKVVVKAYWLLFKKFWLLLILYLLSGMGFLLYAFSIFSLHPVLQGVIVFCELVLLLMVLFVSVLSVWYAFSGREQLSLRHDFKLYAFFFLACCAPCFVAFAYIGMSFNVTGVSSSLFLFLLFFMFFLLDTGATFHAVALSIKNAFKMLLYNAPLCLTLVVIYNALHFVKHLFIRHLFIRVITTIDMSWHISLLSFIIPCSFVGVLYMKRKREQSALYQ